MSMDGNDSKPVWFVRYWYVWVLALAVGLAFIIGRYAGPTPTTEPSAADRQESKQENLRKLLDEKVAEQAGQDGNKQTPDEIIQGHSEDLRALEENPDADPAESAALLSALGNLHRQKKRDYATAARYYEQLIQEYPDWPGVNAVYHQLISCYTQLDDQQRLRLLYRKMLEVFPQDSKEYEYAAAALAGEL